VDDASGLCQLTWHDRCRADDMVVALQQWFAIFGIVPNWMSDQGPHYKKKFTEKLRRIYGSAHHFSPAHCPWSNGTVEVMMRSVRKTI
jgi:transposase InsO family protein